MAYFRVFWHQKLINGNEKITRVTIQGLNVNFSIFWVLIYLVINQNLKPKKRQNWGKNSRNVESIIYLIQLKSLMPSVICFQDDNCEYRRSFFYGMFMSNIIKLISANLQEGDWDENPKMGWVSKIGKVWRGSVGFRDPYFRNGKIKQYDAKNVLKLAEGKCVKIKHFCVLVKKWP